MAFRAHPASVGTMVAGRCAMQAFDEAAVARLNRLGELTRSRLVEAIRIADVPACVTGAGSMFRIHMKETPPVDYRDGYASPAESDMRQAFIEHMLDNGVLLIGTCSGMLSTPMTEAEIDTLAEAALEGFRKIKGQRS